jgi:hypothetical protein
MRSALQKRCVRASRWASLNRDTGLSYAIFPILLLGPVQCQRWVQWHAHWPCAANPDVCYWHKADSLGGLASRPLFGGKQTRLNTSSDGLFMSTRLRFAEASSRSSQAMIADTHTPSRYSHQCAVHARLA